MAVGQPGREGPLRTTRDEYVLEMGAAIHPGEILYHDFLAPSGITQSQFAEHLGVPFQMINQIINRKRAISPQNAWRFAQALGTSPEFWMELQADYDLALSKPPPEGAVSPLVESSTATVARVRWRQKLARLRNRN